MSCVTISLHSLTGALLLSMLLNTTAEGMLYDIYCGQENCYDVLGITKDASKKEIGKSYRTLARRYHPDLYKNEEDRFKAEEQFRRVANAYEILKDEESRMDYDLLLERPEEMYSHYYRYYRRRVHPQVDPKYVVIVLISVISLVQYITSWRKYNSVVEHFLSNTKYRNQALKIAESQGILVNAKKTRGKSKLEMKEEVNAILRNVIKNNVEFKGDCSRPDVKDILWFQLILLPASLTRFAIWYTRWLWRHKIFHCPFDQEEKLYLIRNNFKMCQDEFDSLSRSEREQFLREELWIQEKFDAWITEKEEDKKQALAGISKYRAYRRYMKNQVH